MHFEGDLAARHLLSTFDLPSWPHNDLVSNSVVQLVVDAEGIPFSVTLLERSGHAAADRYALNEARRARFEPLDPTDQSQARDLVWGTLIFQWHTVPAPPSSPPAESKP